ncbi:MAG: Zn-ribbon domain-containing OB-fold protein [Candidatus Thermoplasmatota archaeon]
MPKEYQCTPLSSKEFEKALRTRYMPSAQYSWSAGHAIGRFLSGLREGRILGIRCSGCDRILVPPRAFCEECFVPLDDWVELPDTGRVNTFAISHIDAMAQRIKEPIVPAVIEIDGAGGNGFLHILGEVRPEDVRFDMRVKAVWKAPKERVGDITDIKYFKPRKGGD